MTMFEKLYLKPDILALINNDKFIPVLIKALWVYQTHDEKLQRITKHTNGRGFTHVDGEFMSSLHNFYLKAGFLTPKQIKAARKVLPKYATQLSNILSGKFFVKDLVHTI